METSIYEVITGGIALVMLAVYLFWAYVGMLLHLAVDFVKRKPKSSNSPEKASFKYYWNDNKQRLILALILIPVAIVFAPQLFGVELSLFVAFGIGYGSDTIADILKKKAVIKGA